MTFMTSMIASDFFVFSAATRPQTTRKSPTLDCKEKLGMSFEIAITNFFTEMGTLFASRPLPVIILSVGFALGLSTGMIEALCLKKI